MTAEATLYLLTCANCSFKSDAASMASAIAEAEDHIYAGSVVDDSKINLHHAVRIAQVTEVTS